MVDVAKINSTMEDLTKLMVTAGIAIPQVAAAAMAINFIIKGITGSGVSPTQLADMIETAGRAELNDIDDDIARMRAMIGVP